MIAARRARVLRFLAPWTARDGGFPVRIGRRCCGPDLLTDEALEDLAEAVVRAFWERRRQNRSSQAWFAAQRAA